MSRSGNRPGNDQPVTISFNGGKDVSELSKVLGNSGAPHTIVHNNKTYSFQLIGKKAQNAFEKWLYQQEREAVYVDREHQSSDEYTARLKEVAERYTKGEFGFMGERARAVLCTMRGFMTLLGILTGESEDDVSALVMARHQEVKSLVQVIFGESFAVAPAVEVPAHG